MSIKTINIERSKEELAELSAWLRTSSCPLMPDFQPGGLVKPNPGHWTQYNEENPGAIGVIIEMRRACRSGTKVEAKILWSDMPDDPMWTATEEVLLLE